MTAQEHERAPVELDRTTAADVVECRYRYVTGCQAGRCEPGWDADPSRGAHEKAKHASLLVTLRICPECGKDCKDEMGRARHLREEHGVAARSPYRQDLDARQVKELYDARQAQNTADLAEFEDEVLPLMRARDAAAEADVPAIPDANLVTLPAPPPSLNGHAPALDLSAAQDFLAALLAEVEALRAENARLKADTVLLAQIRDMLDSRD